MKLKGVVSLCLVMSGMALAQVPVKRGEYYFGNAPNTPQCPAIRYLFRGIDPNPVGYVWFADASGMSKATGTMDMASGRFHLTLTSLDGQGPTGEVDGTKDPATGVVNRQTGWAWMLEADDTRNQSLLSASGRYRLIT